MKSYVGEGPPTRRGLHGVLWLSTLVEPPDEFVDAPTGLLYLLHRSPDRERVALVLNHFRPLEQIARFTPPGGTKRAAGYLLFRAAERTDRLSTVAVPCDAFATPTSE